MGPHPATNCESRSARVTWDWWIDVDAHPAGMQTDRTAWL